VHHCFSQLLLCAGSSCFVDVLLSSCRHCIKLPCPYETTHVADQHERQSTLAITWLVLPLPVACMSAPVHADPCANITGGGGYSPIVPVQAFQGFFFAMYTQRDDRVILTITSATNVVLTSDLSLPGTQLLLCSCLCVPGSVCLHHSCSPNRQHHWTKLSAPVCKRDTMLRQQYRLQHQRQRLGWLVLWISGSARHPRRVPRGE